jgi:hypothetical protein
LLALHLWELAATRIDYFYLTENCSYHMLGALEAAAPRLELTSRLKFVVLPMDTVKAVFATPGLVRKTRYVPSYSSRHRAARTGVSRGRTSNAAPVAIPWKKSPELGHGTMRVLFGAGTTPDTSDTFATLGYRLALHDLLDPPNGHPELAQVQFLDTRIRYSVPSRTLTLNHLTFAELIAIHPLASHTRRPSWRTRAYGSRVTDRRCADGSCFAHGLNGSFGASLGTPGEELAFFLMADGFVLFSGDFDGIGGSFVSAGIGPYAGVRLRLFGQNVALLTGTWSYLPGQRLESTYELTGRLRSALGANLAWGVETALTPGAFEAQLLSYIYF